MHRWLSRQACSNLLGMHIFISTQRCQLPQSLRDMAVRWVARTLGWESWGIMGGSGRKDGGQSMVFRHGGDLKSSWGGCFQAAVLTWLLRVARRKQFSSQTSCEIQ